jgi:muramidase (phage lysozyme)
MGPSSVTVKISPLFPSLEIAPDSGKISAEWTTLSNSTSTGAKASTTASVTTTIIAGATSATTTQSTTTVSSVNQTAASLATALKQNNVYGLMLNFSFLYDNTSNCNKVLYNNAYFRHYSTIPSGQNDYFNQSEFVPYNLSSTTANLGGGNFQLVYRTKTLNQTFNNQVALKINVSTSTTSVTGTAFSGAFQGMGYSTLKANYNRALGIGGACGIMVP